MNRIHVLPGAIAERIAAGEVVERPASVVKELIENSIDAGSTAISVEIREGGVALIRVSDNGVGMTREDAALAVERFATSKIDREEDLSRVRTLGFRGEALPSIANVSQLEILTRAREDLEGTRVRVIEGKREVEPAGAPIGTQVSVRGLFYNAPARRKFLKAPLRETELVSKTVSQYALACPQIAFRLSVDGRETLVAPAASPLERIGAIWGREIAAEMVQAEVSALDLSVRGWVSRPTLARASREWQAFFVNGRPIRSGLLAVMLERPYLGRIPPDRHPLAVLQIDLDPQMIDVNVHPRKVEVRFYQERSIYGAVSQAVEQALHDFPRVQAANGVDWPFAGVADSGMVPSLREPPADYSAAHWRAVAQIHNTYILASTPDGFVIVDQHAAQEQIFYERLTQATKDQRRRTNEESDAPAPLSSSVVLLPPREAALLNEHLDVYRSLGIDVEPFGENSFRVNALPPFVPLAASEFMAVLLAEHERFRTLEGDALRDKLAAKAACTSATKAGDALRPEEQQALLDELLRCFSPATCPHGRPVFVTVRLEELERRFLRR